MAACNQPCFSAAMYRYHLPKYTSLYCKAPRGLNRLWAPRCNAAMKTSQTSEDIARH